jgi:hypothetical protein
LEIRSIASLYRSPDAPAFPCGSVASKPSWCCPDWRSGTTARDLIPALIKALARGRAWFEELATGRARSLEELAKRDGISRREIRRLVGLAFSRPATTHRAHRDMSERSSIGLARAPTLQPATPGSSVQDRGEAQLERFAGQGRAPLKARASR